MTNFLTRMAHTVRGLDDRTAEINRIQERAQKKSANMQQEIDLKVEEIERATKEIDEAASILLKSLRRDINR